MTQKQKSFIDELINALPEDDKNAFEKIALYLCELGYIPQKQKVRDFVLSFKHNTNGKVIAKMGIRKQNGFVSIRFFACKNVPGKYMDALRKDIGERKGQYSAPLQPVNPLDMITNKCGYCGSICSGGGLGYCYKHSDGTEVPRCGAYPVIIPDVNEDDVDEMKQVIREQHDYFISIS